MRTSTRRGTAKRAVEKVQDSAAQQRKITSEQPAEMQKVSLDGSARYRASCYADSVRGRAMRGNKSGTAECFHVLCLLRETEHIFFEETRDADSHGRFAPSE